MLPPSYVHRAIADAYAGQQHKEVAFGGRMPTRRYDPRPCRRRRVQVSDERRTAGPLPAVPRRTYGLGRPHPTAPDGEHFRVGDGAQIQDGPARSTGSTTTASNRKSARYCRVSRPVPTGKVVS